MIESDNGMRLGCHNDDKGKLKGSSLSEGTVPTVISAQPCEQQIYWCTFEERSCVCSCLCPSAVVAYSPKTLVLDDLSQVGGDGVVTLCLSPPSDLSEVEPNIFLRPFLEVVRSEDTTGPITGLALTSVNKFLSYCLIGKMS